ncbi:MBL fold metallo-hydrolase [Streptomyces sp. A7024]|uniref:MBL fold metallo-hydrolase n=1 Tax=Streptomyces coryli TaxID=1128680 RepID=A0A6G4TU56_9ACTN|nr:MBL fold metallo-hydrolase [Streptomyces coryli]NGN63515.1 MBL fold metallo-hydrolase [Streptomyces coryli]
MSALTYLGGPTALVEYGGLRLLLDPTFDPPGDHPVGERKLVKLGGPALSAEEVGAVDVVLLSHDQHPDNLDDAGREFALRTPLVLSTRSAEERLGAPVRALANWETHGIGDIRITGVPAQHGPDGVEHLTGEVTGFVLRADRLGLPAVYVSGDNASLEVVRQVADRTGPIDVAVLFAGAARTPLVGDADLTLSSANAARAAAILGARQVIPLHFEQWAHFTQGPETLTEAFAAASATDLLRLPKPGERLEFS